MLQNYFLVFLDWLRKMVVMREQKSAIRFKEKEIWWCTIGINIGVEIYGKGNDFRRPVLIFKKLGADSFLGIPLTSQQKDGSWYAPIYHGGRIDRAALSQIRVFDRKRLTKRMGTLGDINFQEIKDAFAKLYCS